MLACDWNGHSYSASITRAADLKALVHIADLLAFDLLLAHRRLADVVVDGGRVCRGMLAPRFDHSILSACAALMAFHSFVGDHPDEILVRALP